MIEVKISSKQVAQDSLAKALGLYSEFNTAIGYLIQLGLIATQDEAGLYRIQDENYQHESFEPDFGI